MPKSKVKPTSVTYSEYLKMYDYAKYWEGHAKKMFSKNLQLYNTNRSLMYENEVYIIDALKTGRKIYKKS